MLRASESKMSVGGIVGPQARKADWPPAATRLQGV